MAMTIRSDQLTSKSRQTRVEEIELRRAKDNCLADRRTGEKIEKRVDLVLLWRETKKQRRWTRGVEVVTKQIKFEAKAFLARLQPFFFHGVGIF